jgi:hypothetical protein
VQAIRRGARVVARLIVLLLGFDETAALDCLVLGEAALLVLVAAAAGAGIIASGLGHAGRHR